MTARLIFFNGFVGRTAKAREQIIRERIEATVARFRAREEFPDDHHIQKVVIVGEANQTYCAGVQLMKWLGASGIPVEHLVLAGDAWNTFRAIELFVIKAAELYPDQHIRVHVATHEWLLDRTIFYMQRWHKPDAETLAVKARECCPMEGYQPTWWERLRESFRRSEAVHALAWQDDPMTWQNQMLVHDINRLTI